MFTVADLVDERPNNILFESELDSDSIASDFMSSLSSSSLSSSGNLDKSQVIPSKSFRLYCIPEKGLQACRDSDSNTKFLEKIEIPGATGLEIIFD